MARQALPSAHRKVAAPQSVTLTSTVYGFGTAGLPRLGPAACASGWAALDSPNGAIVEYQHSAKVSAKTEFKLWFVKDIDKGGPPDEGEASV